MEAWVRYLRGHAKLMRELNAELVHEHGLTINDYEVLLHLARAEHQQMRRIDLANQILLTASGVTRLLDGLERAGWVCKRHCDEDARVTWAVLTEEGRAKLRGASDFHCEGIQRAFATHYSEDELATLAALLARLGGGEDGSGCSAS